MAISSSFIFPAHFRVPLGAFQAQMGSFPAKEISLYPSASRATLHPKPVVATGRGRREAICRKRASKVFRESSEISQDLSGWPMIKESKHFYEFGPFRVDPDKRFLLRFYQPVPLQPKAFKTLLVLL
jgi:hypothetical protein